MAINIEAGSAPEAIQYRVVKNAALSKTRGVSCYNAQVIAPAVSLKQISETLANEGSKYKPEEVQAILTHTAAIMERELKAGKAVNFGSLVRFRPSIRGKFASLDAPFDKSQHALVVTASVGSALRTAISGASVTRIDSVALPELKKVFNGTTGTQDTLCSEGDLIVQGKRLIWDDAAEDEGFFTVVEGQKVKCEVYKVDEAGTTAFMHSNQFMADGDEAQLYFATRNTSTGELAIFAYDKPLVYESAAGE